MSVVRLLCLLVSALLLAGSPAQAGQGRNDYVLSFDPSSVRRFHVSADLPVSNGELSMAPRLLAEPLPGGWADYIENLSARDLRGRPVGLTHLGSGQWKLSRSLDRLRIDYDVALKHDEVKWAISGLYARAYAVEDAAFFFGHVAFITGGAEFRNPARVRFNVPEGWQAVTALPAVPGTSNTYEAKDWAGLILTGNMVGQLSQRGLKFGSLHIPFTAPRSLEPSVELMTKSVRPIVEGYVQDFGSAPPGKFAVFFGSRRPTGVARQPITPSACYSGSRRTCPQSAAGT